MHQPHHWEGEFWRLLRVVIQQRMDAHRRANDRPQNTDVQTAMLRGRIAELKDLLALEHQAPSRAAGLEGTAIDRVNEQDDD